MISDQSTSRKTQVSDLSKLDASLHKTHINALQVPKVDICRSIVSLSKIAHQCGTITHSAKEIRQQEEQWGWGLEATGKGGWTKFEKGKVVGLVRTPLPIMVLESSQPEHTCSKLTMEAPE